MRTAAKIAKIGDRLLTRAVALLVIAMLLFGGYSLWDMWSTAHGAFISSDLLKYKPTIDNPEEAALSLHELRELNDDVRGWITIDGTNIDYPVVQGKNDMEYVNKDVFGEFSLSGAIFLSSRNSSDFTDSYNLIYGHNVDGGAMFADVSKFGEKDFFEAHRTGTLFSIDKVFNLEVFAVVSVNGYDEIIYREQVEYNDPVELQKLLDYYPQVSPQSADIGIKNTDRIVALSTCVSVATYGRMVLLCRMTEIREVKPA